jgi:serine/threonine-protein kinase
MTHDKSARMSLQRFQQIPPLPPGEVDAPPTVFALVETMMSLDPTRRFQTPSQLLDAIRAARRDLDGQQAKVGGAGARSLFIVERDEELQDKMRKRFKDLGYRVFISGEPTRALDRFHQQPFDALLVNAATVGEDGRFVFQQIMADAYQKGVVCAAILLLAPEQAEWARRINLTKNSAIIQHPVRFTQVRQKLDELLEAAAV